MSSVLGTIFARRYKSAALRESGGHKMQKHMVEHEVIDRYIGHEHGEENHEAPHANNSNSPSFMLHLWSALPVLLVAYGSYKIAIVATLLNFFLIQTWTSTTNRYIISGFVSFIAALIYLASR